MGARISLLLLSRGIENNLFSYKIENALLNNTFQKLWHTHFIFFCMFLRHHLLICKGIAHTFSVVDLSFSVADPVSDAFPLFSSNCLDGSLVGLALVCITSFSSSF